MNKNHEESNPEQEASEPTTLIDCPSCDAEGEDWLCAGTGNVWLDQHGKTIKRISYHNSDGFDY